MDIGSILGIGLCFIFMILSIVFSAGITGVKYFLDAPSAMITFGGAFMAVLASRSLPSFISGLKSYTLIFKMPADDTKTVIKQIIDLSNTARKEGLLALEEAAGNIEDAFMKKGVMLIVDGTEPELVKGILEAEIDAMSERHKENYSFFGDVAGMGPSWGMIGTLLGLVLMLQNMSDPSSIGPSMAVALITTFYGSVLANWFCFPAENKLKARDNAEYTMKSIVIEGLLSIQAGENPRVTEEKLKSFLSPANRAAYEAENGTGDGGGE
ncbi:MULTISPECIES: motility protein A [unclassified Butyrivibrio]|uniref:motility protein A n=1 Tax=unclassified Butyrivibrio TaxID=2639466 RepID=UPI00040893D7|nr:MULTISPECIES: motility protein A [unclassified Butyrivibrio]